MIICIYAKVSDYWASKYRGILNYFLSFFINKNIKMRPCQSSLFMQRSRDIILFILIRGFLGYKDGMDNLINFFVKQKKLAIVFTLSIIVVGVIASFGIQRDQFPIVDLEQMRISASYPGNSPEDIEINITNPIEDELKTVSDIKKYESVSREGSMYITVSIEPDVDDIQKVKQAVKDAVNRVKGLPSDLKSLPRVRDIQPTHGTVLQINLLDKTLSYDQMRQWINYLEKELTLVTGVARVTKSGYLAQEVSIYLNPSQLNRYKISITQVLKAIKDRNTRYTIGRNDSKIDERNLVVLSKFDTLEAVNDVVILSSFDGPQIRLKDIARIVIKNEEEQSITRVNGKKGFILRVKKQNSADIIKTVDLVKNHLNQLKKNLPPNLEIFYTDDASFYVRNRLTIVSNNGLIGLALILLVLSIFLSFRTAFWVAISLPVVIFGMVILLKIFGQTINLVSLAAVILVLGLVVDDSIIVAESIHHYRQKISNKYQATLLGFKRVINPILTTILTTVLAFSSMFLMTGTLGKFIYIMPVVVIFALIISLFEIVVALPAHLTNTKMGKERIWFRHFEHFFEKMSYGFLRFRYGVVLVFIAIFVSSIWLGSQMKFALFPEIGTDKLNAKIELSPGSSLAKTQEQTKKLEQIITQVVGQDLDSLSSEIGRRFRHIARLEISLIPAAQRVRSGRDIYNELVKVSAKELRGVGKIRFFIRKPGPPIGRDVQINLVSSNDEQRLAASNQLAKILQGLDGFSALDRDDELGKGRVEVILNYQEIGKLGLDLPVIKQYLQSSLNGLEASTFRNGQDDVAFQVYLDNHKNIEQLKIPNKRNMLIPIKQFASVKKIKGESDYNHYNGDRVTTISGSADDNKVSSSKLIEQALDQLNLIKNYPQVRSILGGGSDETKKSIQSFGKAFALAVLGIYLLLMLLLNSYTQPLMVISIIPLSIVGVVVAIYLHQQPISFFSILGTLALVGVIVNDALILVNHLNYLKQEQIGEQNTKTRIIWIAKGTKERLRAVILTTLTTLAGVLPLAYGIGGIDYILQPMALALGYGLVFGTIITLILIPALYLINLEITGVREKLNIWRPFHKYK